MISDFTGPLPPLSFVHRVSARHETTRGPAQGDRTHQSEKKTDGREASVIASEESADAALRGDLERNDETNGDEAERAPRETEQREETRSTEEATEVALELRIRASRLDRDPEHAISELSSLRLDALAPTKPSPHKYRVAAEASREIALARRKIEQETDSDDPTQRSDADRDDRTGSIRAATTDTSGEESADRAEARRDDAPPHTRSGYVDRGAGKGDAPRLDLLS